MVEYLPYFLEDYIFVDKEGEEIFWDRYVFKPIPSSWKKGDKLYTTEIFVEQSLYDLERRIKRKKCNCKGYKNRKNCKHLKDAEAQLNKFVDICYDNLPVSKV